MKRILTAIWLSWLTLATCYGQSYLPLSGGTLTGTLYMPNAELGNYSADSRIFFRSSLPYQAGFVTGGTSVWLGANFAGDLILSNSSGVKKGSWNQDGTMTLLGAMYGTSALLTTNLGIGTTTPVGALQIKGKPEFDSRTAMYLTNNATDHGRANFVITSRFNNGNDAWAFGQEARNSIVFSKNQSAPGVNVGDLGAEKYSIQLEGNSNSLGFLSAQNGNAPNMVLTQSGNMGIGTADPQGYKLAVKGDMIAESIMVKVHGTWPDYVLTNDYALKPLAEVEKFIREKEASS